MYVGATSNGNVYVYTCTNWNMYNAFPKTQKMSMNYYHPYIKVVGNDLFSNDFVNHKMTKKRETFSCFPFTNIQMVRGDF